MGGRREGAAGRGVYNGPGEGKPKFTHSAQSNFCGSEGRGRAGNRLGGRGVEVKVNSRDADETREPIARQAGGHASRLQPTVMSA